MTERRARRLDDHVTTRRLAACVFACYLVAQIAAGTGFAATEPPPPQNGVAGTSTVEAPSAVTARESPGDDGTSLMFGLLLGGLAAALFLLLLAVVPLTAAPRLAGLTADRRLDMALAGALALLVVTIVYLSSVL